MATLVCLIVAGMAVVQHRWLLEKKAACERPQEVWQLSLGELKEDGVIRTTEKSYDAWTVKIKRTDDDTIKLVSCRKVAGKQECYDQQYVRRFGGATSRVSKP